MSERREDAHKLPPSSRSFLIFFVVGGIMLGGPLVVVFTWHPFVCDTSPAGIKICSTPPKLYTATISFLPFVMILGGVIIAFNMKRIADSIRREELEKDGMEG